MKKLLALIAGLALCLPLFGAVYPARTNANNVFYGTNTFVKSLIVSNGITYQVKASTAADFTADATAQLYNLHGTNQIVTLPNATNTTPGQIYRFSSTNGWGSYTLNTARTDQSIRQQGVTNFTQIGVGESGWYHDGQNWWPASKSRVVFPSAQFSCSTNITMAAANTAYPVTLNSTDFNNSQGIALLPGTNGLASKMWITNSGIYQISPSLVYNLLGNHTVRMWFRTNNTNIPNSCTFMAGANGDVMVMTVPFIINVTKPMDVELWIQSSSISPSASILAGASASGNFPATPSVIIPVWRISDPWP